MREPNAESAMIYSLIGYSADSYMIFARTTPDGAFLGYAWKLEPIEDEL